MRRREELLGAARRVIGRDGFAAATVGTITREAGASLGLLNYHFGSKDEVVAEAFADAAREDLAALEAISGRFEDPADRLAAYLDQSEWADSGSWRLWVDAWGEAVHSPRLRDTLGRFDAGWRAVLAQVLEDGVRAGRWACADPQDLAARLVAVIDGIGLHATVHDVAPARAAAWARRLAELELGVVLPGPPARAPVPVAAAVHETRIAVRPRDLDTDGHVEPAVLFTFLEDARSAWLGGRVPDAAVSHVAIRYRRPVDTAEVVVSCTLDHVGRATLRTRETVADATGIAVEAAATLDLPRRGLTPAELEALAA